MKVWLDDIRKMPARFDRHVKTAQEAIELLETGLVTFISFDHDLGPVEAGTGHDCRSGLWSGSIMASSGCPSGRFTRPILSAGIISLRLCDRQRSLRMWPNWQEVPDLACRFLYP